MKGEETIKTAHDQSSGLAKAISIIIKVFVFCVLGTILLMIGGIIIAVIVAMFGIATSSFFLFPFSGLVTENETYKTLLWICIIIALVVPFISIIRLLVRVITGRKSNARKWISYTLSKTERQIDGINNNQWYNARQDRTHDFAIVASYELSRKWTLSANWVYYTGDAITFPAGKYQVDGQTVYYYTNRNAYRMPAYHRLDLGATCKLAQRKKWSSELAFSLYNAYGRENAYTIIFRDNKDDPNKTEAVKVALFKFIPSISYNFKF